MKAKPGDRIIIAPPRIETPVREGEVVETRGPDGSPPFLVRWSDGHEALIFPGPGSGMRVQGAGDAAVAVGPATATTGATGTTATATAERAVEGTPRVHDWQVRISIFERDDETDAHVVLLSDTPGHLSAHGHSHRSAGDRGVPEIGDEVAVARALRVLADQLLDAAASDIEEMTGEHDVTLRSR